MDLTAFQVREINKEEKDARRKKIPVFLSFFVFIGGSFGLNARQAETVKVPSSTELAEKPQMASPHPWDKKFYLRGITITPGGFAAGEGVWRSRNEESDIGSNFFAIPLGNSPLYYMQELRFSARQSRVSVLAEGPIDAARLISGYAEADFLGNGTANQNESNSFDLRIRNFYATVEWLTSGWHLLAGQNWSLATMNTKGITPRNELPPPTIDAQYVPGFVWKRQPQFRLTKNFSSGFWAALSLENPQYTLGGSTCGIVGVSTGTAFDGISGQYCFAPGVGTLPSLTAFSINKLPDVIGKLAHEATLNQHKLHLEVLAIYRQFYDRVLVTGDNHNRTSSGYGFGAGAIIEVLPGTLDLQGSFLSGHGIGSYGTSQLPDATLTASGEVAGIPETIFLFGATLHATPKLDLYLFGGKEQEKRKYFNIDSKYFGYGIPTADNSGCSIEGSTECTGNTQSIWQITTGFWDKVYKGAYGELKAGLQYSYTMRELFSSTFSPNYATNDSMIFISLRYLPFA